MNSDYLIELDEEIRRFNVFTNNRKNHVGYLNYAIEKDTAEIQDVILNEQYRQFGIGSELVKRVIKIAKVKGCKSIKLLTQIDDSPVHNFYKKHGFRLTKRCTERGCAYFELILNQ